MSENGVTLSKKDFANIYIGFVEKMDKEMEEFMASYKKFDVQQVYNDWYTIGFYESYYDMLSCEFIDDKNVEEEIVWLSDKEKPLNFLFNKWLNSDGAFSHNWDDMLDFVRKVYEDEYIREHSESEKNDLQTKNNHLGEFNIPSLMNTLANNTWYGKEPTKMSFCAGDDVIELEGYTYEPGYEDFSSTASISFNGETLYGLDSRNVAAYKNEVYHTGKYKTLEEALYHIREQIKGKEIVQASEPSKLDKKIESATARSKENMTQGGLEKDDIVLE